MKRRDPGNEVASDPRRPRGNPRGSQLSTAHAQPVSKMAAGCTRWGIFGASLIAHDFLIALRTLPENEHKVVAVSSRSLERASEFADRHSIEKAYGSYEDLARDADVEVVYVSSIHPQHAPLCKLALSHGKHVLCEKPMTMNLKETKEVFELAKAKGLFIMEVRIRTGLCTYQWFALGWGRGRRGGGATHGNLTS